MYLVPPNPTYLQTAKDGIATFLPLSSASVDATCANCRYFWYSANTNDFSRFVKNTNLLLGSVLARLALITRDASYMTPAEQVYVTEQYEIASRANFRYLGYNDPKYSPSGVMDAHLATEIWALNDIALSLTAMGSSSGSSRQQLLTAMAAAFWQCGDTCKASLTTDYGVRVACELAPDAISPHASSVSRLLTFTMRLARGFSTHSRSWGCCATLLCSATIHKLQVQRIRRCASAGFGLRNTCAQDGDVPHLAANP